MKLLSREGRAGQRYDGKMVVKGKIFKMVPEEIPRKPGCTVQGDKHAEGESKSKSQ